LQTLDQRGIHVQGLVGTSAATICESAVDLAAAKLLLQPRAQPWIEGAQVFGQPQRCLEETMVHAAQFADQRAGGDAGLGPRKAGHAGDHGYLPFGWAQCNNGRQSSACGGGFCNSSWQRSASSAHAKRTRIAWPPWSMDPRRRSACSTAWTATPEAPAAPNWHRRTRRRP